MKEDQVVLVQLFFTIQKLLYIEFKGLANQMECFA